jgi:hypothetical protein
MKKYNYKKIKDYSEYISKITKYCKCGHSIQFRTQIPYVVCNYCGNIVFANKKSEYDFKIKRLIKR